MKLKGSLPCSQEHATGLYLEPVHTILPYSPKINSNIIFLSTLLPYEWSIPFRFPRTKFCIHFSSKNSYFPCKSF